MQDLVGQGLQITAIGMGLVFGALALLWGIMALMGRLLAPQEVTGPLATPAEPIERAPAEGLPGPSSDEMAAIAVALAILQQEAEAESALGWRLPPVLTRWAAVGYSRKLHQWQPRRTKRDA